MALSRNIQPEGIGQGRQQRAGGNRYHGQIRVASHLFCHDIGYGGRGGCQQDESREVLPGRKAQGTVGDIAQTRHEKQLDGA